MLGESKAKAALILRLICHLYDIERKLREGRAAPRLWAVIRQSRSRPILERIHRVHFHFSKTRRHLPKSLMGKAIHYALGQWPVLVACVKNGQIEIDDILCENAIRPTADDEKNWLFIGAEGVGQRSAMIYSIIISYRSRGIDPAPTSKKF